MKRDDLYQSIEQIICDSPKLLLAFIVVSVILAYSNTLYSPPVLDDRGTLNLLPSVYVDDISIKSLEQLSSTIFGKARLIPLMTIALDHRLGHGNLLQFHATNILIHLLTTLALYSFLISLMKTKVARQSLFFISPMHFCLFVTAFWALSPLQTNAVTYIVQRMASLAALFYLTSLAFYVQARISYASGRKLAMYSGCAMAATLALFSKENSATLPLAILLVECLFISPDLPLKVLRAAKWYHYCLIILVIIIALPIGVKPWHDIMRSYDFRPFTLTERLLTQSRVVVFYLSLLLLPLPGRLNLDHDFSVSHSLLSPPATLFAIFFLLFLLVVAYKAHKHFKLVTFGIYWFLLNLAIESTFVPLELIFEHRLYLPSVGFFMSLLTVMDFIFFKINERNKISDLKIVFALFLIIHVSAFTVLTTIRNHSWRDFLTINQDVANKSPNKPRALVNLGAALSRQGQYEKSRTVCQKALSLAQPYNEETIRAASNILITYILENRIDEAITEGEKFLNQFHEDLNADGLPEFAYNLGMAYTLKNRYSDALKTFSMSFEHNPDSAVRLLPAMKKMYLLANESESGRKQLHLSGKSVDVPLHLAELMIDLREYDNALMFLDEATRIAPDDGQLKTVSAQYDDISKKNKQAAALSLIQDNPSFTTGRTVRGLLYLGNFIEERYTPLINLAGHLYNMAQRIEPDNPFVIISLTRWHLLMNRPEIAVKTAEKAIPRYSDFPPLLELAGNIYLHSNHLDKATIVFKHLHAVYPGHPKWRTLLATITQKDDSSK